jgi:hypothetical protein
MVTPPWATPQEFSSSGRSGQRDLGLARLETQQLEAEHADERNLDLEIHDADGCRLPTRR